MSFTNEGWRGRAKREPQGPEITAEGVVDSVAWENADGFRILRVKVGTDFQTWLGTCPVVVKGQRVTGVGHTEVNEKHGEQLRLTALTAKLPTCTDGMVAYLASGLFKGIGKRLAERIVARFGDQTIVILDADPSRIREVRGVSAETAATVAEKWLEQRAIAAVMVTLQRYGISVNLAAKIVKFYKQEAAHIVENFPYRLVLDIDGVGFKTADAIALNKGLPADSAARIEAGLLHTLREASGQGHCYLPLETLLEQAGELLSRPVEALERAIEGLEQSSHVVREEIGGVDAVFLARLRRAELNVTESLRALLKGSEGGPPRPALDAAKAIAAFEKESGFEMAPAQREAVELAARERVMVLTGPPGVGKSAICSAMLKMYEAAELKVVLAAPTGRASKRLSEATGHDAATLHRVLVWEPRTGGFALCRANPIPADVVLVDESSMIDVRLAESLLDAVSTGTRLLFVGDVDQLPSVGPGAVLRDVITSGIVPTARLTQIFRQAKGSQISIAAQQINAGQFPTSAEGTGGEFYVIERAEPADAADTIVDLVTKRIPDAFGFKADEVQVLTPMHKGETGTIALNEKLQAILNPNGEEPRRKAKGLRVGDRVMQTRNNYDLDVYNGDIGVVTRLGEEGSDVVLYVRFDDREVPYENADLSDLTLAYCISAHKSQGAGYAAVVVVMLTAHYALLSRNLLYTAVTRGKRLVCLVTQKRALKVALSETRKAERHTALSHRLAAPVT